MGRLLPHRPIADHYDLGPVLGDGPLARTYAAVERATGAEVVLKQVSLRGLPGWKPVELFEREVAVLRALKHPGVPRLVDAFQSDVEAGGVALVLVVERVPGEPLLALIERGHRWEEAAARAVLEKLLSTLDHLHRLSPPVIHRDIKPSNVVIRPDGQPVLIDFGAVREVATRAGHSSLTVVGTAGYMPPEQAMGAAVPASDLYALGATMIHALTHCHPADLPRHGLQLAFADRLGCSDALTSVLETMVEPDVRVRYARAADVLADLARGGTETGMTARAHRERGVEMETRRRPPPVLTLPPAPRELTKVIDDRSGGIASARALAAAVGAVGAGVGAVAAMGGAPIAGWLMAPVFAGVAVLAGKIAYSGARNGMNDLYVHGTAVEGRIREIKRVSVAGEPAADLRYAYEMNGRTYEGELGVTDLVAGAVDVGFPILVVCDPKRPRRHVAVVTR